MFNHRYPLDPYNFLTSIKNKAIFHSLQAMEQTQGRQKPNGIIYDNSLKIKPVLNHFPPRIVKENAPYPNLQFSHK
jgi:hypothetical protein